MFSKYFYSLGRKSRDLNAIEKSIKERSLIPIIKRLINKWIGKNIVSKLWIK